MIKEIPEGGRMQHYEDPIKGLTYLLIEKDKVIGVFQTRGEEIVQRQKGIDDIIYRYQKENGN